MFLPRKEFVVEPPHHSMDHGPVDVVKHEEGGEGKKKRGSISSLFKRKGEGRSESETEVQEHVAKHDEDGEGGKKVRGSSFSNRFQKKEKGDGKSGLETEVKEDDFVR